MMKLIHACQEITSEVKQVDLLRSEDLVDLWPGAEICQKGPEGSLSEHIRLHGVILKSKHHSSYKIQISGLILQ